jgi:hypothetical protein
MASTSAIDTEAAGSGLCAANSTAANAIGAGAPSNPTGQYVVGTSAALTVLLTTALAAVGEKVTTGAVATESTVLMFDSTERANQASLSI